MFMNYMDYTDDACMYMFTNDQKIRMQTAMQSGTYRWTLGSSPTCTSPNKPDFIVVNETLSVPGINAGGSLTTYHKVKNQGTGDGNSSYTAIWLSKDQSFSATEDINLNADVAVPALTSGQTSSQFSKTITIPPTTASGQWYIMFGADATTNYTNESNELNNQKFVPITVTNTSSCTPSTPTGAYSNSPTQTTIYLYWNSISNVSYKVRYRKQGTTTWSEQLPSSANVTLTNLFCGTTYEWGVQSYCSSSSYSSYTSGTFTTSSCGSTSAIDNCSQALLLNSNTSCNYIRTNVSNTTQSGLTIPSCSGYQSDFAYDVWFKFVAQATSHTIKVDPEGTYTGSNNLYIDPIIAVYTSCSATNPIDCADDTGGGGGNCDITVNGLRIGDTYYIRVFDYNKVSVILPTYSNFDICVTHTPPPCNPISNVSTSNYTQNSVTINWSNGSGLNDVFLNYRAVGQSSYTSAGSVFGNTSKTLNGLTCGTAYEFYFISNCSSGTQYRTDGSFATSNCIISCTAPYNLQLSATPAQNTANLSWINGTNINNSYIRYRKIGTTAWSSSSSLMTTTNSYTLTGLECNTDYESYVISNCVGGGTVSSFPNYSFTTAPCTPTCSAPTVSNPSNQNVTAPNSASFSITASGGTSPYTYQWQYNTGSGWNNVPNSSSYSGVTSSTLYISSTTSNMNGYQFRCVVSSASPCTSYSSTSNAATLTLNATCSTPTAIVNDASGTSSVTLTCNTSGGSGGNILYKWYSGTSCSGNVIGTNSIYTATTSGNYACKAYISGYESTCYSCDYGYATVNATCSTPTAIVNDISGSGSVTLSCGTTGGSGGTILYKWYNGTSCSGSVLGTSSTYTATTSGYYTCKAYISGYESTCYSCDYGYATINTSCSDSYEPNNSYLTSANPFSTLYTSVINQSISSFIYSNSDEDWYRIGLNGPGTLTIDLTSLPDDYDIYLYDSDGTTELSIGALGGTNDEQIIYNYTLSTSTLKYIKIIGYNGNFNLCDNYVLGINWAPSLVSPNLTKQTDGISINENSISFNITVVNNGTGTAGTTNIGYYASTNNLITTSDCLIGTDAVNTLTSGNTITLNKSIDLCNIGCISSGTTYYIGYIIDYQDAVSETNENDNGWILTSQTAVPSCNSNPCNSITTINGCGASYSKIFSSSGTGIWNNSVNNSCLFLAPGSEKIYRFTAPTTGIYSIQVTSTTGGFIDYQWQSICNSTGWNCIQDVNNVGEYGSMNWTSGNTYYILLDDEDDIFGSHTFYVNCPSITSVRNNSNNIIASIYPNPNNGEFIIELDLIKSSNCQINITNMLGQKVYEEKIFVSNLKNKIPIQLSGITNGAYNVSLIIDNENYTKQIIITK